MVKDLTTTNKPAPDGLDRFSVGDEVTYKWGEKPARTLEVTGVIDELKAGAMPRVRVGGKGGEVFSLNAECLTLAE